MKTFKDYGIEIPTNATGPNVATQCPNCSDQRKKKLAKPLSVNIEKKTWLCHHCGWAGGMSGRDTHDVVRHVKVYRKPEPRPESGISNHADRFFTERGITVEVLRRNQIDSCTAYSPQIEAQAPCATFPYLRAGECVNRKYRTLEGKNFRLEAGCELILYGLDDIQAGKPLYFTEGEMDKLSLEVAGFPNAVSVPNGAPPVNAKNYESLFPYLNSAADQLATVDRFVIAVDNDGPGIRLREELSRRLGVEKCSYIDWPAGCKDANDVLVKHGADDLRWYLENPTHFPIDDVSEINDLRGEISKLYQAGWEIGLSTGWKPVDNLYTVRAGEFTVVSGVPSSGKSNWIDAMFVNLAELHGWRFAIFSPENLPLERHMSAIVEKRVRKPFHAGYSDRMSPDELTEGLAWCADKFWWIMPANDDSWTIDRILTAAGQLTLRHGIRGLVIDPWNELESLRPDKLSETEYISKSLKSIKAFARQRRVHVWVVIHPTKMYRDKEGKYPVPTLYDCAGSSHWRNKADNGIVVSRDLSGEDRNVVEIHVQKIRFRDVGKPGMAQLYYEPMCATYSDQPKWLRVIK